MDIRGVAAHSDAQNHCRCSFVNDQQLQLAAKMPQRAVIDPQMIVHFIFKSHLRMGVQASSLVRSQMVETSSYQALASP